jgi:MraZ protein
MAGLYGNYKNSLDPNGRVAIPAKIRNAFPESQRDKIYITRGIDTCITGYHADEWKYFCDTLKKINIDEKNKRKLRRQFLGRASEAVFDKQGRIIIPADLVQFAKLEDCKEVIIVGSGNIIEIWNPDIYENEEEDSEQAVQDFMGSRDLYRMSEDSDE